MFTISRTWNRMPILQSYEVLHYSQNCRCMGNRSLGNRKIYFHDSMSGSKLRQPLKIPRVRKCGLKIS